MPSDMKIWVKTASRAQRKIIKNALDIYGRVTDVYEDQTFEFTPFDNACHDRACEVLEDNDTEFENI